ncbi:MAG: gluconokinase [Verrucomicrobiota bacterium]
MSEAHPAILISGISLAGKSTLARALVEKSSLPLDLIEGDDLHTKDSIAKMSSGIPLDDADREGWRARLGELIAGHMPPPVRMITCSALSRRFRDQLRGFGAIRFVFLTISPQLAQRRAQDRLADDAKHFFQPSQFPQLLAGQFRDQQIPSSDEVDCFVVQVDHYLTLSKAVSTVPEPLINDVTSWLNWD